MEWQPIEGFPNYSVSPTGQVRNNETRRHLKPLVNQSGILFVELWHENRRSSRSLIRLVADTYLKPHPNEPFDTPIHLDGVRSHVAVDNLLWRPRWFAIRYHNQFDYDGTFLEKILEGPLRNIHTGETYKDSYEVVTGFGVLNQDVRFGIALGKVIFPTYLELEIV